MIFFYVSLSTYIAFCILKYRKSLLALEKENYSTKKYTKWLSKNAKEIFITPELLLFILIIVALNADPKIIGICTVIAYTLLFLYELKTKKGQIKITKKHITRIIVIALIYIIVNIWFYLDYISYHSSALIFDNTPLYYIIIIIMGYLSYFVVWLANVIVTPFGKLKTSKKKKHN